VDSTAAAAFASQIADGGLAVFPTDTVYGLAADPESEQAVARLNALKRRDRGQPSGIMFFSLADAAPLLADLGPATREACERLLPGPVTLVVPNPGRRFPLACGDDPRRIGLRVPAFCGRLAPLATVSRPVLQSSANLHGGADPRRLEDVPAAVQAGADLVLDGGELPGIASTVVDLSGYEEGRRFEVLREAAVSSGALARRLDG
jgi:L-threonylcarbamoyladenylate synthase